MRVVEGETRVAVVDVESAAIVEVLVDTERVCLAVMRCRRLKSTEGDRGCRPLGVGGVVVRSEDVRSLVVRVAKMANFFDYRL